MTTFGGGKRHILTSFVLGIAGDGCNSRNCRRPPRADIVHFGGRRKTIMRLTVGAAFAAVLALAPPACAASDMAGCLRLTDQDAVTRCTQALQSTDSVSPARRAELHFARGNAYLSLQRYQNAVDDFTAVIELDPTLRGAYVDRGVAYHHLRQYERAIRDYDRAIALNSDLFATHYNRALSYFRLGRYAEAWKDFDDAVKRTPDDAKALYGRGLSKARLGGSGDADFAAAKRLDPDIADKFAREGLTPQGFPPKAERRL
jgi:tetratricopeptide (TPR) repeat protein